MDIAILPYDRQNWRRLHFFLGFLWMRPPLLHFLKAGLLFGTQMRVDFAIRFLEYFAHPTKDFVLISGGFGRRLDDDRPDFVRLLRSECQLGSKVLHDILGHLIVLWRREEEIACEVQRYGSSDGDTSGEDDDERENDLPALHGM